MSVSPSSTLASWRVLLRFRMWLSRLRITYSLNTDAPWGGTFMPLICFHKSGFLTWRQLAELHSSVQLVCQVFEILYSSSGHITCFRNKSLQPLILLALVTLAPSFSGLPCIHPRPRRPPRAECTCLCVRAHEVCNLKFNLNIKKCMLPLYFIRMNKEIYDRNIIIIGFYSGFIHVQWVYWN